MRYLESNFGGGQPTDMTDAGTADPGASDPGQFDTPEHDDWAQDESE